MRFSLKYRLFLGALVITLPLILLTVGLALAQRVEILIRVTTASNPNRDSESPSLNFDGSKIAFESDSKFNNLDIPDSQFEIWLYDRKGMTFTRITTSPTVGRDSKKPSLSADATRIAFESDADFLGEVITAGQTEIWLYDTTTQGLTRVTTSASDRDSRSATLSADGTKIAFESDADFGPGPNIPAGQTEIWLYDVATQVVTRVTVASASDRDSRNPSLNADGTKLAFQSNSDFGQGPAIPVDQREIWLYDVATDSLSRITTASAPGRDSQNPSLNADGTRIAFDSDSDFLGQGIPEGKAEIWIHDTTTTSFIRITESPGLDIRESRNPSLSADGLKVAFESDGNLENQQDIKNNQFEIWVFDTESQFFTRASIGSDSERDSINPTLSGDGLLLSFQSDSDFLDQGIPDEQNEIWLRPAENKVYLPAILK